MELLRLLFSNVDEIIDCDYETLYRMKEAISNSKDMGECRKRKRRSPGFKNSDKSDIN